MSGDETVGVIWKDGAKCYATFPACLVVVMMNHAYDLTTISNVKVKTHGTPAPVFLFVCVMYTAGGVILFDHPRWILLSAVGGLLLLIPISLWAPGLIDWVDKTALLGSMGVMIAEFYYYGRRYDRLQYQDP